MLARKKRGRGGSSSLGPNLGQPGGERDGSQSKPHLGGEGKKRTFFSLSCVIHQGKKEEEEKKHPLLVIWHQRVVRCTFFLSLRFFGEEKHSRISLYVLDQQKNNIAKTRFIKVTRCISQKKKNVLNITMLRFHCFFFFLLFRDTCAKK